MALKKRKEHTDRSILTVEEAGHLLGISRGLAYEAVRRGEIPAIRIGRRILVPVAALEKLLLCAGLRKDDSTLRSTTIQSRSVERSHQDDPQMRRRSRSYTSNVRKIRGSDTET